MSYFAQQCSAQVVRSVIAKWWRESHWTVIMDTNTGCRTQDRKPELAGSEGSFQQAFSFTMMINKLAAIVAAASCLFAGTAALPANITGISTTGSGPPSQLAWQAATAAPRPYVLRAVAAAPSPKSAGTGRYGARDPSEG
ncbi:hypothetical protein CTheo_5523 [Ceratobasidium theobromae]|uniref:Uncharacterized protein n=1 Tax=Ceratobasidium theobromae TaxID=1582974 RepID=A0A5N5QHS4_9AGAM|nr:hypothetical protein CTheo_5523 [Ceratobasidium theobromae]